MHSIKPESSSFSPKTQKQVEREVYVLLNIEKGFFTELFFFFFPYGVFWSMMSKNNFPTYLSPKSVEILMGFSERGIPPLVTQAAG